MSKNTYCSVTGCPKPGHAKGLCHMHYNRLMRCGEIGSVEQRKIKYPELAKLGLKAKTKAYRKARKYIYHYDFKSIGSMHKKRFGGMREFILRRDHYQCVMCGMTREQHKRSFDRDLTLNHINHLGRYSQYQDNDPDNLETLCLRCHGHVDAIKHGKYSVYKIVKVSEGVSNNYV